MHVPAQFPTCRRYQQWCSGDNLQPLITPADQPTRCELSTSKCLDMYTLNLAVPFKGKSMYIKIDKKSQYQIWLFQVLFAFC